MLTGRLKTVAEEVKLALRVTGDDFDPEVAMLVESAAEDMKRVGISEQYVEDAGPLVRLAMCTYAKARFGFDNPEADRFDASYRQLVIDMLHSSANADLGDYQ